MDLVLESTDNIRSKCASGCVEMHVMFAVGHWAVFTHSAESG
jgi:hypothetical protein